MSTAVADRPTQSANSHKTIFELFAEAKREIGPVGKDSRNTTQNFNFRGVDAVVNAAAPALDKHGVITVPRLDEVEYTTVEVGQNRTRMAHVRVKVTYTFHGPAGDSFTATVPGEAMDSGDKGTAKAMSVAYRIALIQALNLPTHDTDPDSQTYERSPRSAGDAFDQAARPSPEDQGRQRAASRQNRQGQNGQAQNGQGQNGRKAPRPLPDGDPWKQRIEDIASRGEADQLADELQQLRAGRRLTPSRYEQVKAALDAKVAAMAAQHQDTPDDGGEWVRRFVERLSDAGLDQITPLRREVAQAAMNKVIDSQAANELVGEIKAREQALKAAA